MGRNETGEQAAENSNSGSALLGFAFPNLGSLAQISCHCKAGYCCPLASQGGANLSGNSNQKVLEGLKSVMKYVILSGGWLQPIQAGVRPGFMGNCSG